jgi:hypothetical protein
VVLPWDPSVTNGPVAKLNKSLFFRTVVDGLDSRNLDSLIILNFVQVDAVRAILLFHGVIEVLPVFRTFFNRCEKNRYRSFFTKIV